MGEISVQQLQHWVLPLLALCREAGAAICEHYRAPGAGEYAAKRDESPLTQADLASHALLVAGLHALEAALPVLSEESAAADIVQRRSWPRYWLVDPLDGTKEFLERTGEFTINIALVVEHRPVLGVLYLPLEEIAYVGIPGTSAQCYRSGENGSWIGMQIATRPLRAGQPLLTLASRRHGGARLNTCLNWLGQHWESVSRDNMGGALKFCRLADGKGDFYPRFSPCSEWDTAAGQAVLEAAGGCVLGLDGQPLRYNCRDSLDSPPFFAIADRGHPLWQQLLHSGSA
jgi:3'(2'), 5'-bisphosphate nucleotidase